jgi:hypothetical protein
VVVRQQDDDNPPRNIWARGGTIRSESEQKRVIHKLRVPYNTIVRLREMCDYIQIIAIDKKGYF